MVQRVMIRALSCTVQSERSVLIFQRHRLITNRAWDFCWRSSTSISVTSVQESNVRRITEVFLVVCCVAQSIIYESLLSLIVEVYNRYLEHVHLSRRKRPTHTYRNVDKPERRRRSIQ